MAKPELGTEFYACDWYPVDAPLQPAIDAIQMAMKRAEAEHGVHLSEAVIKEGPPGGICGDLPDLPDVPDQGYRLLVATATVIEVV